MLHSHGLLVVSFVLLCLGIQSATALKSEYPAGLYEHVTFNEFELMVFTVFFDEPLDVIPYGVEQDVFGIENASLDHIDDPVHRYYSNCTCSVDEECSCFHNSQFLDLTLQLEGTAQLQCQDLETGEPYTIESHYPSNCDWEQDPKILLGVPTGSDPLYMMVDWSSTTNVEYAFPPESRAPNSLNYVLLLRVFWEDGTVRRTLYDAEEIKQCNLTISSPDEGTKTRVVGRESGEGVNEVLPLLPLVWPCSEDHLTQLYGKYKWAIDQLIYIQTKEVVQLAKLQVEFMTNSRAFRACDDLASSLITYENQETTTQHQECRYEAHDAKYADDPCCNPDVMCCTEFDVTVSQMVEKDPNPLKVEETCNPLFHSIVHDSLHDLITTRARVDDPVEGCHNQVIFSEEDAYETSAIGYRCESVILNNYVVGIPCVHDDNCYTSCEAKLCKLPDDNYVDTFIECFNTELDDHTERFIRNTWNMTGSTSDEEFNQRFKDELMIHDCMGPSGEPYRTRRTWTESCVVSECGSSCTKMEEVVQGDSQMCTDSSAACSICSPTLDEIHMCRRNCDNNDIEPTALAQCAGECLVLLCIDRCTRDPQSCLDTCANRDAVCVAPVFCSADICLDFGYPDEEGECNIEMCPQPPFSTDPSLPCTRNPCSVPYCDVCASAFETRVPGYGVGTGTGSSVQGGSCVVGTTDCDSVPGAYRNDAGDFCEIDLEEAECVGEGHTYLSSCGELSLSECQSCAEGNTCFLPHQECYVHQQSPCDSQEACEAQGMCSIIYEFTDHENPISLVLGCVVPYDEQRCEYSEVRPMVQYCHVGDLDMDDCNIEVCEDTCGAPNGVCEDALSNTPLEGCAAGSDCTDCGPRGPVLEACSDACLSRDNGVCEDGGEGSVNSTCAYGTDCTDCGSRELGEVSWVSLANVCVYETTWEPTGPSCSRGRLTSLGCVDTTPHNCLAEGGTLVSLPKTQAECENLVSPGCNDLWDTDGIVTPKIEDEECSACGGDDVAKPAYTWIANGVWEEQREQATWLTIPQAVEPTKINHWQEAVHQPDVEDLLADAGWVQHAMSFRSETACRYNRIFNQLLQIACACSADNANHTEGECGSQFTNLEGEKIVCSYIGEVFQIGPANMTVTPETVPIDEDCLHLAVETQAVSDFKVSSDDNDRISSDILSHRGGDDDFNEYAVIYNDNGAVVGELISDAVTLTLSTLEQNVDATLEVGVPYHGPLTDPMLTCIELARVPEDFTVVDIATWEDDVYTITEEGFPFYGVKDGITAVCKYVNGSGTYFAIAREDDWRTAEKEDDDDDVLEGVEAYLVYFACFMDSLFALIALIQLIRIILWDGLKISNSKIFYVCIFSFNLTRAIYYGMVPSGKFYDLSEVSAYVLTELPTFIFFSNFTLLIVVWMDAIQTSSSKQSHTQMLNHVYVAINTVFYVIFTLVIVVATSPGISDDMKDNIRAMYMIFISTLALTMTLIVGLYGMRLYRLINYSNVAFARSQTKDRLMKTTVLMVTTSVSFALHAIESLLLTTTDIADSVPVAVIFMYLFIVEMVPSASLLIVMRHNVIPPGNRNKTQKADMVISDVYRRAKSIITTVKKYGKSSPSDFSSEDAISIQMNSLSSLTSFGSSDDI